RINDGVADLLAREALYQRLDIRIRERLEVRKAESRACRPEETACEQLREDVGAIISRDVGPRERCDVLDPFLRKHARVLCFSFELVPGNACHTTIERDDPEAASEGVCISGIVFEELLKREQQARVMIGSSRRLRAAANIGGLKGASPPRVAREEPR